MASSSATLHEDNLKPKTVDQASRLRLPAGRAGSGRLVQPAGRSATDPELAAILAHNRDEEKSMPRWCWNGSRRGDPKLDEHLRTYLFTEGSLLDIEAAAEAWRRRREEAVAAAAASGDTSLGIGSLRGTGSLVVDGAGT